MDNTEQSDEGDVGARGSPGQDRARRREPSCALGQVASPGSPGRSVPDERRHRVPMAMTQPSYFNTKETICGPN
jgi:hypothetical protein